MLAARVEDAERKAVLLQWGLVPSWSKDGRPFINARAEGIEAKPSFRTPFKKRRCLVPADGYFEWKVEGKHKQPYYFRMKDGSPFVFAGLWDRCQDVETCATITTTPNEMQAPIHDRMPVILDERGSDLWLSDASPDELLALLVPFPAKRMECYPVSTLVGSPRNNREELLEPLAS